MPGCPSHVISGMPVDGHASRLCGVLVPSVAALRNDPIPSLFLDQMGDLSNLHGSAMPLPAPVSPQSLTPALSRGPPAPANTREVDAVGSSALFGLRGDSGTAAHRPAFQPRNGRLSLGRLRQALLGLPGSSLRVVGGILRQGSRLGSWRDRSHWVAYDARLACQHARFA